MGGFMIFCQAMTILVSIGLTTSTTVGNHFEYKTARKITTRATDKVLGNMMPTQHLLTGAQQHPAG